MCWQHAGRRHFAQLVADPYENEAVGETKLAATLARHDRKPQVTAALDVTKSGNLMGIDQRGVDGIWVLVEAGCSPSRWPGEHSENLE